MGNIKKLAGQTMWYGASSIAARFLFYLLTPYFTARLTLDGYGDMSNLYAAIPFLNVLFTYGLETAYFRFSTHEKYKKDIYGTAIISIVFSTLVFAAIMIMYRQTIAHWLRLDNHPEFITLAALIISFDTLSTLPFAKLRLDQRPRKYALIRIFCICLQIAVVYFLLSVCPVWAKENPIGFWGTFYNPNYGVGYIMIANLVASAVAWFLLIPEFLSAKWTFSKSTWYDMMIYSLPLLIAGFGGMINETFDRIMITWLAPGGLDAAKEQTAIYSACYKLSILITLFIQAFRLGAEPFFFKQAEGQQPQKVYARVMKFFVITISLMFLVVMLYLDIWKYFLSLNAEKRKIYETGLKVVPILLFANMFLGIYYNLAIWYKLTHQTMAGAWITIIGAALTLFINYFFIPVFGYMASAWATFICYGSMMVISYIWGQKKYPVPYAWKKLIAYMVIALLIYWIHKLINFWTASFLFHFATATILIFLFALFILRVERKEFAKVPVIRNFLKP